MVPATEDAPVCLPTLTCHRNDIERWTLMTAVAVPVPSVRRIALTV